MTYTITPRSLGFRDAPAGDQSANSTTARFARYLHDRPEEVLAVVARLGPNATLLEVVAQLDILTAPQGRSVDTLMDQTALTQQRRYIVASEAFNERVARGEEENRQKAAAAALWRSLRAPAYDPDYAKTY